MTEPPQAPQLHAWSALVAVYQSVLHDVVQALAPNGPSTIVGHLPQPRADLVEAMSTASATLYGLSPLTRPAAR